MNSNNKKYDVIVIGSGLGGLTTAALLAKASKKRVLVLERHYEPGGLTHEFKRGHYSWDVGLHYVGNLRKRLLDFIGWKLFAFITNGKLKWNKMPDVFDKFVFPEDNIEIKGGVRKYRKELQKKFPDNKREINRYIKDIHKVRIWVLCHFYKKFLHFPFTLPFFLLEKFNKKKALMTTKEYLDKYITNDKLKVVLSARWGNYGLAPEESAFAVHSVIEHHYYMGAMFPEGGAEKIATYMEEVIEQSGGNILTNREAVSLIMEDKKVVGVKVKKLTAKEPEFEEYYASKVVSSVGVEKTFFGLVPADIELPIKEKLRDFHNGYSGLNLYLGLKDSPEKLGIKGENIWIFDNYDINSYKTEAEAIMNGKPTTCFVSFPSLKSGSKGGHTADIVVIFPYKKVKGWTETFWKERPPEYQAFKDKLTEGLLDLIEKYIPGFKDMVVYKELATPLTFEHFTGKKNGLFYGLPATPERYKIDDIKVKTGLDGLYLTGTDLISDGITSALFSGLATASYLTGPFGIFTVVQKAFMFRGEKKVPLIDKTILNHTDSLVKVKGLLIDKKEVKKDLFELTYRFDTNIDILPGQHIKLLVADGEWRAYSTATVEGNRLSIIVDSRFKGFGSEYAKTVKVDSYSIFRLPLTDMIYHETDKKLMFIATGTGIVPFIHIMDELKQMNKKHKITVVFGCMEESDNFVDQYIDRYSDDLDITRVICVENAPDGSSCHKGRVTDIINNMDEDINNYEYYICGHPHMTQAVVRLLKEKKAEKVYW